MCRNRNTNIHDAILSLYAAPICVFSHNSKLMKSKVFIKLWMMAHDLRAMWTLWALACFSKVGLFNNILPNKYRMVQSANLSSPTYRLTPHPAATHRTQHSASEERPGNVSSSFLQIAHRAGLNYNNHTNRATHGPTWLEGVSWCYLIYVTSQKLHVALLPNNLYSEPGDTFFLPSRALSR